MKTPAIRATYGIKDTQTRAVLEEIKQNINFLKQRTPGQTVLTPLNPATAQLSDVITSLNLIIGLLTE